MKHLVVIGLVAAMAQGASAQSPASRPALDFVGGEAAFARSAAARYAQTPLAEALADLRAQGFVCAEDYCTRTLMDGACAVAWTVDVAADQSLSGRQTRQCMGGEDEE